jgi:hypothetical protein
LQAWIGVDDIAININPVLALYQSTSGGQGAVAIEKLTRLTKTFAISPFGYSFATLRLDAHGQGGDPDERK